MYIALIFIQKGVGQVRNGIKQEWLPESRWACPNLSTFEFLTRSDSNEENCPACVHNGPPSGFGGLVFDANGVDLSTENINARVYWSAAAKMDG